MHAVADSIPHEVQGTCPNLTAHLLPCLAPCLAPPRPCALYEARTAPVALPSIPHPPSPPHCPPPPPPLGPQGYYDDNLDFIRIERVQIVGTMTPPGSVGRHALSTRFTALTRIMHVGSPDKENLTTIYTSTASKVCCSTALHRGLANARIPASLPPRREGRELEDWCGSPRLSILCWC